MRRPLLLPVLVSALAAAGAAHAGALTLAMNHSVRLALPGPAASVVVGNPAVADVTVVDSRTVFVSGRGPGSTDVSVLDPLGRTLFSGDVRVMGGSGSRVIVHRGVTAPTMMACDPACGVAGGENSASGGVAGDLAKLFGDAAAARANASAEGAGAMAPAVTNAAASGATSAFRPLS